MIAWISIIAAAASAAAPSPPAPTIPAATTAKPAVAQKAATDGDKIVCKYYATTGTRFAERDCRPKAQWDQIAADSKQATIDTVSRQTSLAGGK
ncbi:MAG: hypothetical protein WA840_16915 [Caulobacteraceae bacterium]